MKDKVQFQTNVPVSVALAYANGLDVEGRFGDQVMYTLEDDRVMYVAPVVRRQIEELGIRKGQEFTITKTEKKSGSHRSIEWRVELPADEPAGNNNAQSPAVARGDPKGGDSERGAACAGANGHAPSSNGYLLTASGQSLTQAILGAVDVAMAAERYAANVGWSLRFSSEDVRAIGLTIFIQQARNGGRK